MLDNGILCSVQLVMLDLRWWKEAAYLPQPKVDLTVPVLPTIPHYRRSH